METEFIPYKLAMLAQTKGFNERCFGWYNYNQIEIFGNDLILDLYAGEENRPYAPIYSQIISWFRNKHNIDITIMPVFREKCGYDSFKRDGYTFNIMRIEPCQFLTWADFNQCAEDRDEENKEPKEDRCLVPSFKDYYECMNMSIEQSFKLI